MAITSVCNILDRAIDILMSLSLSLTYQMIATTWVVAGVLLQYNVSMVVVVHGLV